MKKLFTILMAALLCIGASAQIAQDAYNKWHQNKYSMFIHFGLYSVYGGRPSSHGSWGCLKFETGRIDLGQN